MPPISPELLEQEYQPAPLAAAICHELGPDEQAAAENTTVDGNAGRIKPQGEK
jgi:hypothetical protein